MEFILLGYEYVFSFVLGVFYMFFYLMFLEKFYERCIGILIKLKWKLWFREVN